MIYFICLIVVIGVLALDLISKTIVENLNVNTVIISKLLKFKFTYNKGASFGMLSDKEWAKYMFIALTTLVCLAIIAFFIFIVIKKCKISKWLLISLSLVLGGALGNLIDRILLGKVRDFIFLFYETRIFPAIFNVADIALCVSVAMICFYILFLDKDAVFKIKSKDKKDEGSKDNS